MSMRSHFFGGLVPRTLIRENAAMPRLRILLLLLFPLLAARPGLAADEEFLLAFPPPPDHRFWMEFNSGLENSRSVYGELDLLFGDEQHLLLGAGQSDLEDVDRRVNLYSYTLGFNSAYGAPFEIGGLYEFWGNTDVLWTHSFSLPLRWSTRDWSFDLRPGYTAISLYLQPPLRPRRQIDTSSEFLEGRIIYCGLPRWRLSLGGSRYAYAQDLSRLQQPRARSLFSDVTLVLGYGFPRSRMTVEATRHFSRWQLGAAFERTIAEVDGSRVDIASLKGAFDLNVQFSLHTRIGRIESSAPSYNYLQLAGELRF